MRAVGMSGLAHLSLSFAKRASIAHSVPARAGRPSILVWQMQRPDLWLAGWGVQYTALEVTIHITAESLPVPALGATD
jgi:hypothetical protein